jgi:cysteine desulfurase
MDIYLDNNRMTRVDEQVLSAMRPVLEGEYGDLFALHSAGAKSRKVYHEALDKVYASLHASSDDTIVFTSGGAESNSMVFQSTYLHYILTGRKNNVIVGERESLSVMKAAKFLESQGCRVNYLPVNSDGVVESERVLDYITPRTALVSVSMVDGESGAINPIEEIAKICADFDVPLHCDATHAMGKIDIDLQDSGIDFLTISAETLHAPAGTGTLYIRKGRELIPLIHGERGGAEILRGGPLNLAGIAGLGKAVELSSDALSFEMEDVRELRDSLEESISGIDGSMVFVPWAMRSPNTLLCAFEGVDSESLLYELNRDSIQAYSPSVNPYGNWDSKSIVKAVDADRNLRFSTIGFALSRFNTEEEMEKTAESIKRAVEYLRSFSPSEEKR